MAPQLFDLAERVNIFVVSDRPAEQPSLDCIHVIDPGRKDGDSIWDRQSYSELRAHYWVWKNAACRGMVGFFQFRRYLDLSGDGGRRSFYLREKPVPEMFAALEDYLNYDVVAPLPEYTGETVADRYARKHDAEELRAIQQIIIEQYPGYAPAMEAYLRGKQEYYCNLYLMRADVMSEYFGWLFDILDRYTSGVKQPLDRVCGYLAERLFGIWYTRVKQEGRMKCAEVPRLHFWCFDDAAHHYRSQRLEALLLPPGSRRKALLRRLYIGTRYLYTKGGQ